MIRMMIIGLALIVTASLTTVAQDTTTHASTNLFSVQPSSKPGYFRVDYTCPIPGNVTVKVYDEDGYLLVDKAHPSTNSFAQDYNFVSAPRGEYTFVVQTPMGIKQSVVEYSGIGLPDFSLEPTANPQKLRLVVNEPTKYPFTIFIRDEEGNLLHSQTIDRKDQFEQLYNMEQVQSSRVTFVVMNQIGDSVSETYSFR